MLVAIHIHLLYNLLQAMVVNKLYHLSKVVLTCIIAINLFLSFLSPVFAVESTYVWSHRISGLNYDAGGSVVTKDQRVVVVSKVNGNADANGDGDTTDGGAESAVGYGSNDLLVIMYNLSGDVQWSKRLGSTSSDGVAELRLDDDGNTLILIRTSTNFDLNGDADMTDQGESNSGYGSTDNLITSFSASGTHNWSKRFGGSGSDEPEAMDIDEDGNIFILHNADTGDFDANGDGDTTDGGAESSSGYGNRDIVISALNQSGTYVWSKRIGTSGADSPEDLRVDPETGFVYVTGTITSAVADLNGDGDTSDGGAESLTGLGMITVFNASGTHQWAKRIGINSAQALGVSNQGNVTLIGTRSGAVDLNGDDDTTDGNGESATGYGSTDFLLTTFNSSGTYQWSLRLGSTGAESAINKTRPQYTSADDVIFIFKNLAAATDVNGDADTTDGGAETVGDGNSFLVSLSSTGSFNWAKRLASSSMHILASDLDSRDTIYLGGYRSAAGDADGDGDATDTYEVYNGANNQDAWFSVFNSSGTHQWARRIGSTDYDYIDSYQGISADGGHVAVFSWNEDDVPFDANGDGDTTDSGELTPIGQGDNFITFWTDDLVAPVASSVLSEAAVDVTIEWTTDEASSSIVEYGLTNSYGTTTDEEDTSPRVTAHSVTLSGLATCTTYHYRVKSTDAENNTVTGSDDTFVTSGCPTPTPGPSHPDDSEEIQIPQSSDGKNLTGGSLTPIKDSSTNSQEVTVIIEPGTLSSNAYLSAQSTGLDVGWTTLTNPITGSITSSLFSNTVKAGGNLSGGGMLGIKTGACIAWQVGSIQKIWFKTYPPKGSNKPAAIIIPELQSKPSIIGMSYTHEDLTPPGQIYTRFAEAQLKLAHSIDGSVWRIMPTSVVDPVNNTVAALEKIGGYYMIVASCGRSSARSFAPVTLGETTLSDGSGSTEVITSPTLDAKMSPVPTKSAQPVVKTESFFQRITKVVKKILNIN